MKNSKKTKSILKGASFFLATFAFCGLIALGSRFIKNDISNPGYEISTTSKVAYAEETASLSEHDWYNFKNNTAGVAAAIANVTSVVTSLSAPATQGSICEPVGTNVMVDINGSVLTFYSTDGTEIYLHPWEGDSFDFSDFSHVTTMDLHHFNTSNLGYMSCMFSYFSNLTTLNLSGWDTSNVYSMDGMFAECSNLANLDLTGWDTSNVEDMSNMFWGCYGLTSLNVSNFNTSNVTNMEAMFCATGLTSLDLSNFDTSKVTNMKEMFYGNSDLASLNLTGWDTSKVQDMDGMFSGCWRLTSLDVSSFNTSKIEDMDEMFRDCTRLTSLDLSNFNTSNVTRMWGMFNGCESLTSIDLSSFNTSNVEYMNAMFKDCESLTSIDLSNFDTTNVEGMSYMFLGCRALTSIDLSNFNTSNLTATESMFEDCENLKRIDLSSFDMSNVDDAPYMFNNCQRLRRIYLPKVQSSQNINLPHYYHYLGESNTYNLLNDFVVSGEDRVLILTDEVENTDAILNYDATKNFLNDYVKYNSGITKIVTKKAYNSYDYYSEIGDNVYANINGDTLEIYTRYDEEIELMANAYRLFENLSYITSIDLSACDTSEVTNMGAMFAGCGSLTNIIFGESFNTSRVTNMNYMFGECILLTELDLSVFNTSKVTDMSAMFAECNGLQSIDLSSFNTSNVETMFQMFYNCQSLKNIDLSSFDSSALTTISAMFYGCEALEVVDLSSFELNECNVEVLFFVCDNLKMIYLPKALSQNYDCELGNDFCLATNHEITGNTLNAFTGYESTALQKNAIVKKGVISVVAGEFGQIDLEDDEIEYYYGDSITVDGATLTIGDMVITATADEIDGYTVEFVGWSGIENGVVVDDEITATFERTPIEYTITTVVNGESTSSTYTIESDDIEIENQTTDVEGYTFIGWTWEGQTQPVKDVVIETGSIGNKTLTANFGPIVYTVTVNVDGDIDTIEYTIDSDDITVKNPTKSGLKFDGWVDEDGNKYDELVVPAGSTGDKHFQATWKTDHTIKYVAIGVLSLAGVFLATEIFLGCLKLARKKK